MTKWPGLLVELSNKAWNSPAEDISALFSLRPPALTYSILSEARLNEKEKEREEHTIYLASMTFLEICFSIKAHSYFFLVFGGDFKRSQML